MDPQKEPVKGDVDISSIEGAEGGEPIGEEDEQSSYAAKHFPTRPVRAFTLGQVSIPLVPVPHEGARGSARPGIVEYRAAGKERQMMQRVWLCETSSLLGDSRFAMADLGMKCLMRLRSRDKEQPRNEVPLGIEAGYGGKGIPVVAANKAGSANSIVRCQSARLSSTKRRNARDRV
ncbi:ATP synthase epsilon chain [Striga asiatica]|uniref:ATP synthase epsilon chain n=1 Tax=Striga asiatica TaxID=4170 RepID=A0A5A7Q2Q7_STRAF|nr:ATP synthase epsilon chain [Striga asiatica]